jgi:hypothetical protein
MATQITKKELFENFFSTSVEVLSLIESTFNLPTNYISGHVFNMTDVNDNLPSAKDNLEQSDAWQTLSQLYDYSIDGIIYDAGYSDIEDAATDLVLGGAEVISIITTENHEPSQAWDKIIMMGDGRFSLDTGGDIEIMKLALLADVDIRTVRNAVSSGELTSNKVDNIVFITNRSALLWLSNRRAFKPTKFITSAKKELVAINGAVELGAFLQSKRESMGLELPRQSIHAGKSVIQPSDLRHLESGVFDLPLYTVDALADFYQIPKVELLNIIMSVFFPDYLRLILEKGAN